VNPAPLGIFHVAAEKSCKPVVNVFACPAPTSDPVGTVSELLHELLPLYTAMPALEGQVIEPPPAAAV
jgi:hypothetical protein